MLRAEEIDTSPERQRRAGPSLARRWRSGLVSDQPARGMVKALQLGYQAVLA